MATRDGAAAKEEAAAGRKRALDEVVPPAFVAREDEGGAYGILEMPKRFTHDYVWDKGRVELSNRALAARLRAIEVMDARSTAQDLRVFSHADALIRRLKAEAAARAAAGPAGAGHSHPSPSSL